MVVIPNLYFDNFERSFIVRFSFLEHDLTLFLQQHDHSLAIKHIRTFQEQMRGPLHHINSTLLKQSVLGLIGDLSSCGFANQNSTLQFIQLRLELLNFWNSQTVDQLVFLTNLQPIFDSFFSLSTPADNQIKSQLVTHANREIIAYINLHLEQKITVSEIIQALSLSPTAAPRRFKKEVGRSISSYLQRARIILAGYWLVETNLKLSSIASQLQFYDSASFSKQFKQVRGITPSQYRRQNQL